MIQNFDFIYNILTFRINYQVGNTIDLVLVIDNMNFMFNITSLINKTFACMKNQRKYTRFRFGFLFSFPIYLQFINKSARQYKIIQLPGLIHTYSTRGSRQRPTIWSQTRKLIGYKYL